MEFIYAARTDEYTVHVWLVHDPGFYELELVDFETGETIHARTFEGTESDAKAEAVRWMLEQ
jgi:hypothetical protein